jgi:hypothetical protein
MEARNNKQFKEFDSISVRNLQNMGQVESSFLNTVGTIPLLSSGDVPLILTKTKLPFSITRAQK